MTDTQPDATSNARHVLTVEPLSARAFLPFGDVIEANESARHFTINDGFAERYHDLARVDVNTAGGRPIISIFKARPRSLPLRLVLLERHPLGSQAFVPLSALPYLVVVAPPGPEPLLNYIRCFRAAPGQGVNYAPGTWHHPLIALQAACDFLVVDRGGAPGDLERGLGNCDEYPLVDTSVWIDS